MGTDAFDIAVVGAGPAGCSAAIKLARLGQRVVMIEQARFPRPHVGEALNPGVRIHLAALGLSDCDGLGFATSSLRWRDAGWESQPVHPGALTVDRGRFDAHLAEAARDAGVHLVQPARVIRVARGSGGWRLEIDKGGCQSALRAGFLIDAAGRRSVLPRCRRRQAPGLIALHADWPEQFGAPCVTAGPDHWIWASQVPDRGRSVILFTDRNALRRRGGSLAQHYEWTIRTSGAIGPSSEPGPVTIHDASTYCDDAIAGSDFLKVGEAAFALDPLSSSGVQKAMASGILAAIACNTVLLRSSDATLALDFYRREQLETASRHHAWTASTYADQSLFPLEPFWRARASLAHPLAQPAKKGPIKGELTLSKLSSIKWAASVSEAFIERRRALFHPNLERPLMFAGGFPIVDLLPEIGCSGVEASLRRNLPEAVASALLTKLADLGVLIPQ